jgi:hypothetical protein
MATIASSFYRDANRVPITNLGIVTKKSVTFAGATTNAWGNDTGTRDGGVLYTVTGLVKIQLMAVCGTSATGAGSTDEVGITGATAIFMPITTMTDLDAGMIWLNNATPVTYFIIGESTAAADNLPEYVLNGNDIIMTTKTANTTAGQVDFYCIWTPISTDGVVTATATSEETV